MQSQKGTWRRVDDLGRVVIPKEIRVCLNVKTGDLIEFCVQERNSVILRKYHRLNDITDIATICTYASSKITNAIILISTTDTIISSTAKELIGCPLSQIINNSNTNCNSFPHILADLTLHKFPIIANGDQHGYVLLYTHPYTHDTHNSSVQDHANISIATMLSYMLSKYLEQ